MKNGSAGVVTALDPKRRTLTVTFEREGVITLPAEYLDAGFVDYGYARTTYGVQGATLDRGLYFAGDESSFEEGYVALTRGRVDTRIYIVDGTSVFDEESSHRGHDPEQTGLDTVAQAMERRRANTLAAERDPAAAEIVHELAGWGLRRLSDELARLDGILAEGPDDVTEALRTTVRRREAVLARRQAWDAGAAAPRPRRRSQRRPRQVGRELDRIERELATLEGRIDQLRAQHADRLEFLDAHRDVVERWRLVHRAIQAEELRVRIEAGRATDVFVAAFGPPPDDPAARQAWQLAAESVAVHVARHGRVVPGPHVDGAEPRTALLGVQPGEASARWSYLRAAQAVDALADGRALTAADEVLVG